MGLSRKSPAVTHDIRTGFEIVPELCTGCGLCQLTCSHVKQRAFSLAAAHIAIERVGSQESFVPRFLDGCDSCGVCINYCGYEAIRLPGQHRSWFVRARGPEGSAARETGT